MLRCGGTGGSAGTAPRRGQTATLYTAAGLSGVFISGASHPLFLLPPAVEDKSELQTIPEVVFDAATSIPESPGGGLSFN